MKQEPTSAFTHLGYVAPCACPDVEAMAEHTASKAAKLGVHGTKVVGVGLSELASPTSPSGRAFGVTMVVERPDGSQLGLVMAGFQVVALSAPMTDEVGIATFERAKPAAPAPVVAPAPAAAAVPVPAEVDLAHYQPRAVEAMTRFGAVLTGFIAGAGVAWNRDTKAETDALMVQCADGRRRYVMLAAGSTVEDAAPEDGPAGAMTDLSPVDPKAAS